MHVGKAQHLRAVEGQRDVEKDYVTAVALANVISVVVAPAAAVVATASGSSSSGSGSGSSGLVG